MLDVLKLDEEGNISIQPELLLVECFKAMWKRDHGASIGGKRIKTQALKEVTYVYFMEYWNSPYTGYQQEKEKIFQIKKDVGLEESWNEDDKVIACRDWYREYQDKTSPTIDALKAARCGLSQVKDFLYSPGILQMTSVTGALLYKPKDVISAIDALSTAHKSIFALEELVRKEQSISSSIRGGGEEGMYES